MMAHSLGRPDTGGADVAEDSSAAHGAHGRAVISPLVLSKVHAYLDSAASPSPSAPAPGPLLMLTHAHHASLCVTQIWTCQD